MAHPNRFTFLTACEPVENSSTAKRIQAWAIDESKYLQGTEIDALQRAAESSLDTGMRLRRFSPIRDWYMIQLGLNTGVRVTEMRTLKLSDLHFQNGRSFIRVLGKGNKIRPVLISDEFKLTTESYLLERVRLGLPTASSSPLLPNLSGESISKRHLQEVFKKVARKAGLPSHLSIHCLRHTYCTYLLKATGNNYHFTQRQMGHSSIRTTQVYAGVLNDEARVGLEKLYG